MAQTIGKRIAKLRAERGLSQRQIARPGTSYAYLSRLEANKRQPSWKALAAIAERLGTTGLYLLTGKHDAVCPFCGRKDEQTERDGNSLLLDTINHPTGEAFTLADSQTR